MMMNIAWEPPIYMKLNAARTNFVKKVTTEIRNISVYQLVITLLLYTFSIMLVYGIFILQQTIVLTGIRRKTKPE